jgi:hypothetical protein
MERGIILLRHIVMMETLQMVTDAAVPVLLKLDSAEAEGRFQTQILDLLCEETAKELALKGEMTEELLLAMDEMLAVRLKLAGHAQEDLLLHKILVLKYEEMEEDSTRTQLTETMEMHWMETDAIQDESSKMDGNELIQMEVQVFEQKCK